MQDKNQDRKQQPQWAIVQSGQRLPLSWMLLGCKYRKVTDPLESLQIHGHVAPTVYNRCCCFPCVKVRLPTEQGQPKTSQEPKTGG